MIVESSEIVFFCNPFWTAKKRGRFMLIRLKIPKTILWVINLFFIFLLIFTIFRLTTFFAFKPRGLSFTDLLPSFFLGIRYDLRWIALILLPIIFISLVPKFS